MTGPRTVAALALAAALACAAAAPGAADERAPHPPTLAAQGSTLLAQRTIERDWGLSEDSVYVQVQVAGLKSEGLATALSAVLPGAGQLYVGEGSGWLFATLEAAGWGAWWWNRRESDRLNREAGALAGAPEDVSSAWSYARWAEATEGDPAAIAALYAADREAFYDLISGDPAYAAGWSDAQLRADFAALREGADGRRSNARIYATAVWINHLVAAMDALRAARFNNWPLRENLRVRVGSRGALFAPEVTMAFEVRF